MAACATVFDYAKVRAVVEDRRSMLGAIVGSASASSGGTRPRPPRSSWLNFALFAGVVGASTRSSRRAPAATGASMWLAFAIGQLYVVARLWVKLVFWASETALFQSRLAHAGYVNRAEPKWPESPEAEAI